MFQSGIDCAVKCRLPVVAFWRPTAPYRMGSGSRTFTNALLGRRSNRCSLGSIIVPRCSSSFPAALISLHGLPTLHSRTGRPPKGSGGTSCQPWLGSYS